MAETIASSDTIISLDESKKPSRSDIPEPKPARYVSGRKLGVFVIGGILLVALILFIWIIISLFRSNSGIDTIFPFLDKTELRQLDLQ